MLSAGVEHVMSRQYYNRYSKRVISPLLYHYASVVKHPWKGGLKQQSFTIILTGRTNTRFYTRTHTHMHTQLCGRLSLLFRLVNTLLSSARNGSSYCPIPAEFV